MENGHIAKYLDEESLDTNRRLSLVRSWNFLDDNTLTALKVLDVALGVEFLHASGVVHGDLKPVRPCSIIPRL
jgi:serine/threonine protein kinase